MFHPTPPATSRRDFFKTSAAVAGSLAAAPLVHAAGSDVFKVGLIGCGGRGTGAAENALKADKYTKLYAMADAFEDRLEYSLKQLSRDRLGIADRLDVAPERRFVGFDAYRKVIDCCDVVLLCTPPHFRPEHLRAAVEAGKHVFAEKPVAVDAPGVRSVLATCEAAKKKNLSIVSGLCLRYYDPISQAVQRVHNGDIGEIVALQANDYRGAPWTKPRQPDWSDMVYQMRNWYNYTWLSGDFNVEQHVHFLDVCAWLMKNEYPVRAVGLGGKQVRTKPDDAQIYDHFSVVYEYANGVKLFSNCRQISNCYGEMSAQALGSHGRAQLSDSRRWPVFVKGSKVNWAFKGEENNLYQTEHEVLFAGIRSGKPVNNGDYMAKSTQLAILGRMAAYTGQVITWEKAMESKEVLGPTQYAWDMSLPEPPVAMPGKTKFV